MVRPYSFRKNEETATNNHYQQDLNQASAEEIIQRAQEEFDGLVERMRSKGVEVIVFEEAEPHATPDALFPNNWISTHANGAIGLYPMYAPNRRAERREDVPLMLEHQYGLKSIPSATSPNLKSTTSSWKAPAASCWTASIERPTRL